MNILQQSYDFLKKQGRPGYIKRNGCVYYGEGNQGVVKCAVGCLLPDDDAKILEQSDLGEIIDVLGELETWFERDDTIYPHLKDFSKQSFDFISKNINLLDEMQMHHDTLEGCSGQNFIDDLSQGFEKIAKENNLEFNP